MNMKPDRTGRAKPGCFKIVLAALAISTGAVAFQTAHAADEAAPAPVAPAKHGKRAAGHVDVERAPKKTPARATKGPAAASPHQQALLAEYERIPEPEKGDEANMIVRVPHFKAPPKTAARKGKPSARIVAKQAPATTQVDAPADVADHNNVAPEEEAKPAEAPRAPEAKAPPPAPKKSDEIGQETAGQIDALMKKAFTEERDKPSAPAEAPPPSASLGQGEIQSAMEPVRLDVKQRCHAGERGVAMVRVEVSPKGAVTGATVEGPFASKPVAGCLEQAVKKAHFQTSSATTFRYPFRLR